MKAIVYTNYSPLDIHRLEEIAKPAPKDDEVLVKINTTKMTIWDKVMRSLNKPIPCYQRLLATLCIFTHRRSIKALQFILPNKETSMKTEQQGTNAIKEVFVFFAITLGLVYFVLWGPMIFFQVPASSFVSEVRGPAWSLVFLFLGGFTPSLVALGLTCQNEGRAGLKQMWQRTIHFRIGWRWYMTCVAFVVFAVALQILFIYLLGGSFDFSLFLTQLPSALFLILIGPLSEELGWRGYAQTRLQTRWNPLVTGVVVGIVWALWHLPLFLWPGTSQNELKIPFIGFFCEIISLSVLFAWLHNRTKGMIWTAVFFHWIYTYAAQVVDSGITRSGLYTWLEYIPYILAAVFISFVWIREMRSNPLRLQSYLRKQN